MNDKTIPTAFSESERAVLHSMAEMFQVKGDRDQLRELINQGATLSELILAYRTQKRMVSFLKAGAGLVVLVGAAAAVLKGAGLWPGK